VFLREEIHPSSCPEKVTESGKTNLGFIILSSSYRPPLVRQSFAFSLVFVSFSEKLLFARDLWKFRLPKSFQVLYMWSSSYRSASFTVAQCTYLPKNLVSFYFKNTNF